MPHFVVISIVPTTDANNTTVTGVPPFVFIWEDPTNVINSQYDGYKCALVCAHIGSTNDINSYNSGYQCATIYAHIGRKLQYIINEVLQEANIDYCFWV